MKIKGLIIPLPPFHQNADLDGYKVVVLYKDKTSVEATMQSNQFFLVKKSREFELNIAEKNNVQDGAPIQIQVVSPDASHILATQVFNKDPFFEKISDAAFRLQLEIRPAPAQTSIHGAILNKNNADEQLNLAGYSISISFKQTDQQGTQVPRSITGFINLHDASFDITLPDANGVLGNLVNLQLKYPNGQEAFQETFVLDAINISDKKISIAPWSAPTLAIDLRSEEAKRAAEAKRNNLKGRVIDLSGRYKVKNAQIILWAKRADNDKLVTVLVSTTDSFGSFSGEYPKGTFVAAFATIAGTLHNTIETALPVDLEIGVQGENLSVRRFPEFIYLPAEVAADYGQYEDDCDCKTFKSFELPSQEDLVNNNSQYAQDIGQGCTNMVTPNRTLEEFTFTMVVRTTDPNIKGTTITDLEKRQQAYATPESDAGAMGSSLYSPFAKIIRPNTFAMKAVQPAADKIPAAALFNDFSATSVIKKDIDLSVKQSPDVAAFTQQQNNPTQGIDPNTDAPATTNLATVQALLATNLPSAVVSGANLTNLNLSTLVNQELKTASGRAQLNADNSMDWDNEPTFYQAVTIAHGHILKFKQIWKAAGYSLGDLLYSVPLAPGQKKNIVIFDWDKSADVSKTDETRFDAGIESVVSHQRDILDIIQMSLGENARGGSNARTVGKSGGVGGGGGVTIGPISIGISGGYSSTSGAASSEAWQNSARNISGNALQSVRDSIMQSSSEFRNQRTTVVASAKQAERYKAETEVIANHNHCHALTIQYFEVLRHYVLEQKLVDVQECLFIPLMMSQFDLQKVMRWKEILRRSLLDYGYDPYSNKNLDDAFPAAERIWNQYVNSDFPLNTYADEQLVDLNGDMHIRMRINRPPDPVDEGQWALVYRQFCQVGGFTWQWVRTQLNAAELDKRNQAFEQNIAPKIAEGFINSLKIMAVDTAGRLVNLNLDLTLISDYRRDEHLFVTIRSKGSAPNLRRRQISRVVITSDFDLSSNDNSKVIVVRGRMDYRTANMAGVLFANDNINDDLKNETTYGESVAESVSVVTPLSAPELRNPRREDAELSVRLLNHLNANLEHYHKAIWYQMDPDRRFMLLDGFLAPPTIPAFGEKSVVKSVASVVENTIIGIAGNSLIMPVAPGNRLDPSYRMKSEVVPAVDGTSEPAVRSVIDTDSLLEHYAPVVPSPPYRVSVPTRGVFAEAIQGACNSCEKLEEGRRDWADKDLDEPTAINPVTTPVPQPDQNLGELLKANPLAQPVINIQNAPAVPNPGSSFTDALNLLGKQSTFANLTGLEGNQKNAIQAATISSEAAKHYADTAADLAKTMAVLDNERGKNVQSQIDKAHDAKAITDEEYAEMTKKNLSNQLGIDDKKNETGSNNNADKPNPILSAAEKAAAAGRDVKASHTDERGNTTSAEISGKATEPDPGDDKTRIIQGVQEIKQDKTMACWAAVATMMLSWKKQKQYASIEEALQQEAGEEYVKIYQGNEGLKSKDKPALLAKLGINAQFIPVKFSVEEYVQFLKVHGPVWITTDADHDPVNGQFSPHARLLVGIEGSPIPTNLLFLDPNPEKPAGIIKQSFQEFLVDFAAMIPDGRQLIAYFGEKVGDALSINDLGLEIRDKGEGGTVSTPSTGSSSNVIPTKTNILGKIDAFINILRDANGQADILLLYGQFPVSMLTNNYNAKPSIITQLFKDIYATKIFTLSNYSHVQFTNKNIGNFEAEEQKRCFQAGDRVIIKSKKRFPSLKEINNGKAISKGRIASAVLKEEKDPLSIVNCKDKKIIQKKLHTISYNNIQLESLYDRIITGLNNGSYFLVGVISGYNREGYVKGMRQVPEHFIVVFDWFEVIGKDDNPIKCFLFWDSDTITTSFNLNILYDTGDANGEKITNGFGLLFGLKDTFSTAVNNDDFIDVFDDCSEEGIVAGEFRRGLHRKKLVIGNLTSKYRHRYQVYYVQEYLK